MKQRFLILFLLPIGLHLHAQELFGTRPPAQQNERYISYANTKANRLLFDSTDPYGFYNMLQLTIDEAARISNFDLRGIASEQVSLVKKTSSYTLSEQITIPMVGHDGKDSVIHRPDGIEEYVYPARDTIWRGIDYRLGAQSTVPIVNFSGKDSVIYLPDGTTEYVYPARDTTWYSWRGFDEIVVREQLRPDTIAGKQTYVPVELFLRRKIAGKPVVLINLNFDALYQMNKTIIVPLPAADNARLIGELERYLAAGEERFGSSGLYSFESFYHPSRPPGAREALLFPELQLRQVTVKEIANSPLVKPGEIAVQIVSDTLIRYDEYGEQTILKDPQTGATVIAFDVEWDTVWCVKKGFEAIYGTRLLVYEKNKSWTEYTGDAWVTKTLLPREAPRVVYTTPSEMLPPSQSWNRPIGAYLKKHYRIANDPLYLYLQQQKTRILAPFEWEKALLQHRLKFTVLPSAIR